MNFVSKIVSGGQPGADRAALDVALVAGITCGGWCPKGRKAEDGRIDEVYPLVETLSAGHRQCSKWNARDSDGTLIITQGKTTGATELTAQEAEKCLRPLLIIDTMKTSFDAAVEIAVRWVKRNSIRVLNITGPRSSDKPTIYADVWIILVEVLRYTNPDAGRVADYPPVDIPDAEVGFYEDGQRYKLVASWVHEWKVRTLINGDCVGVKRYEAKTGQEALLKAMEVFA
jgi:hypothetical protein